MRKSFMKQGLKNWVLKQDDQINEIRKKLITMDANGAITQENEDIDDLKKKITS